MPERHTVVFKRCEFNVITDHDQRTVTLQFEETHTFLEIALGPDGRPIQRRRSPSPGGLARMVSNRPIDPILRAIDRRFGDGLAGWLDRWRTGEESPLILAPRTTVHPENPEVACFVMGVKAGHPTDAALATLLDFLRKLPGYQQTFGDPLDRDVVERENRRSRADASTVANDTLRALMERIGLRESLPPDEPEPGS